jgi:hypothetical protein
MKANKNLLNIKSCYRALKYKVLLLVLYRSR